MSLLWKASLKKEQNNIEFNGQGGQHGAAQRIIAVLRTDIARRAWSAGGRIVKKAPYNKGRRDENALKFLMCDLCKSLFYVGGKKKFYGKMGKI